jgi:transposase InsO family protein
VYGLYGYRRIAAMLRQARWTVNLKRVERIWRQEGLKVPARQPKRSRIWLANGSCLRLRLEQPNHVWSYDFVETRTHGYVPPALEVALWPAAQSRPAPPATQPVALGPTMH